MPYLGDPSVYYPPHVYAVWATPGSRYEVKLFTSGEVRTYDALVDHILIVSLPVSGGAAAQFKAVDEYCQWGAASWFNKGATPLRLLFRREHATNCQPF